MLPTISVFVALAALLSYIGFQQRKEKERPFTPKEGRRVFAVILVLALLLMASGIWFAFDVGDTKRQQYTLLFIIFGGPLVGSIVVAVTFLQRRITNRTNKSKHK